MGSLAAALSDEAGVVRKTARAVLAETVSMLPDVRTPSSLIPIAVSYRRNRHRSIRFCRSYLRISVQR
jgi:hypothetical protein